MGFLTEEGVKGLLMRGSRGQERLCRDHIAPIRWESSFRALTCFPCTVSSHLVSLKFIEIFKSQGHSCVQIKSLRS